MQNSQAERWVVISALVVLAVYGYRRVIEPAEKGSVKNIIGIGNPVPLGQFITAWGFTYLVISIMATADAGLGGAFAILVAVSDLLANGPAVFGDVQKQTGQTTSSTIPSTQANVVDTSTGTATYAPPTNLPNPVSN